jgi:hypothetical protein
VLTEISVYLPNIPGQFSKVLTTLAGAKVSIRGFSVDLSGAISLLRLLFSDSEEAKRAAEALKESAYEPLSAQLLLVSRPDVAGELLKITDILADHDINVEYGYVALGRTETGEVFLALKVARDKEELARTYLEAEGIQDHDAIPRSS